MNYSKTASEILKHVKKDPFDDQPRQDYFELCRAWFAEWEAASRKKMFHQYQITGATNNVGRYTEFNHPAQLHNRKDFRPLLTTALQRAVENRDWAAAERLDSMLFKSLLFGAPHFFEDYLNAVEYGKPYDKRFYAPRQHYLHRYTQAYQEVLEGKLHFLSVSMPKRAGKAVTLDTLLPTPTGFKRMGDVHVGDTVIGADGYETLVTHVFPQGKVPIYEVKFTDGASVKTCGNHLWEVKMHNVNSPSGKSGYSTQILTTKQMLENGVKGGKDKHSIYAVKFTEPVEFAFQDVPLDPYIFGALLGDGCLRGGSVELTSFDHEVTDYIADNLPGDDVLRLQDAERGRYFILSGSGHDQSITINALRSMGAYGHRAWEKFIPREYLFNTSVMRWELLCGLLDTDGCCSNRLIEYSTTSPMLRDDVIFLARSLGGKANYTERMGRYKKNGDVIYTRPNYRFHIQFPAGDAPFKIARKRDVYKPKRDTLYHYIDSITPAGEDYAQCICVDNKDHLFLVSDMFIPTHNSQMGINFVNMLSGRKPNHSTLMEGTGDDLVQSFYKGCLEYLDAESEYHFYDIFPNAKLVQTYADRKTFNLDKKSRFPTVMCRSIDARQVGLSEATNLLYLDDCVEGREEAKNRQRLDDKWEVISGDIIGRAIEGTPIVICGTRYSLYDPIGRLQETARKSGWKWKAIETPALDPVTDETNFEYMRDGKPVFTTAFFREQREILCAEQWESEFQQQPFEAKGLLFNKDELNYFFELPVGREPDTIFAACDTADKGADFTSMPIVAIYDQEAYLIDVVFDDAPPTVTKPECAKALRDNHVASAVFESNNAGSYFARDVEQLLKGMGYTCSIRTKRTISNKETRIEFASDNIIKKFYFRHPSTYKAGSQYDQFFKQLTTYVRQGKVPHDDAPDSLAMLENEIRMRIGSRIEVVSRTF